MGKVSRAGGKVMDAASDLTDSAARVVFGFDDVGRKAMFISLMEAGESPEAARRIVSEVAVEYGPEMMADVDEILRVLSWFYRYNRHRTQQFVEHAARSPQAAVATTKIMQKNAEAMGYDDETALLLEGRGWLRSNPEWMPVNYSLPGLNGLRPTKEQFRRDGPSVPFIRVRIPALEGVGEVARRVVTAPGREFMESLPPPVYAVNLYLESLQQQAQGKLDEAEATQRNALEKLPIIGGYARTVDQFTPEEALPVVGYAGSPRPVREALRRAEKSGHLSPQLIDADSARLRSQRKLYALGLQATWVNLSECLQGLTVPQLKRLLEISKRPGDHYFMPGEITRELKAREGVRSRQPGVKKWETEPKGPRTALQQWRDEGSRDGRKRPQRTHSW